MRREDISGAAWLGGLALLLVAALGLFITLIVMFVW